MLEVIRSRRSIRKFASREVDDSLLTIVVEMGTWAPSGLNNQPWKFVIVRDPELRDRLAELTRYGHIIRNAPACIVVFLDLLESYDRVKDTQAIGACIQNMLLAAHYLDLGAVWLGEILKNGEAVRGLLEVPDTLELMAVVALGYPAAAPGSGSRKPVSEVILARK